MCREDADWKFDVVSIFHCGHVSRKWQFAQAYEDIVLAAKKLSGIVCQNLFIKFFFFMYSGEACWACMLFFHQHPGSWPAFSSVWFFHHSCPGVYSQSEGFQFCSKCLLVLFFLLWVCCFFVCFVWFFTNLWFTGAWLHKLSLKVVYEGQNTLSPILIANPIFCCLNPLFTHIHSLCPQWPFFIFMILSLLDFRGQKDK